MLYNPEEHFEVVVVNENEDVTGERVMFRSEQRVLAVAEFNKLVAEDGHRCLRLMKNGQLDMEHKAKPPTKHMVAEGKVVSLWAGVIGRVQVEVVRKGENYFVRRWEKKAWTVLKNTDRLSAEAFKRAFIARQEGLLSVFWAVETALRIDQ